MTIIGLVAGFLVSMKVIGSDSSIMILGANIAHAIAPIAILLGAWPANR
jgi:hypothetical protein